MDEFKLWMVHLIQGPGGEIRALGVICILIVIFILLKNLFLYLSIYILTPIRNLIVNDMRTAMFKKILALPIGYFNDQKKGDIMSRLTNDLSDMETSSVNLLESLCREPVTIILFLTAMIVLSPQLTLFLIILLPVAGFIIGRIGRSLKKQSTMLRKN